ARDARPLGYAGAVPAGAGHPRQRMAPAAQVGCRMKASNATLRVAAGRAVALLLLCTFSAPATTFYLTMSGLGGEADYTQRFKMWADDIDGSLKRAGGDANVITLQAPTRDQIRARFAEIAGQTKPADALVLMLIGHGTWDGVE